MRGSREIKTAEAERGGEECCRGRQRAREQSGKVPGDSDRDHTASSWSRPKMEFPPPHGTWHQGYFLASRSQLSCLQAV